MNEFQTLKEGGDRRLQRQGSLHYPFAWTAIFLEEQHWEFELPCSREWHHDTSPQFPVKDMDSGTGLHFLNQIDANPDPKPFQEVSMMENGNRLEF